MKTRIDQVHIYPRSKYAGYLSLALPVLMFFAGSALAAPPPATEVTAYVCNWHLGGYLVSYNSTDLTHLQPYETSPLVKAKSFIWPLGPISGGTVSYDGNLSYLDTPVTLHCATSDGCRVGWRYYTDSTATITISDFVVPPTGSGYILLQEDTNWTYQNIDNIHLYVQTTNNPPLRTGWIPGQTGHPCPGADNGLGGKVFNSAY